MFKQFTLYAETIFPIQMLHNLNVDKILLFDMVCIILIRDGSLLWREGGGFVSHV